jgi:hypothetical protein
VKLAPLVRADDRSSTTGTRAKIIAITVQPIAGKLEGHMELVIDPAEYPDRWREAAVRLTAKEYDEHANGDPARLVALAFVLELPPKEPPACETREACVQCCSKPRLNV